MMKKKLALENSRKQGIALTFDDVRLKTAYSEYLPDEVDTQTKFSRNVTLKIPIVSAAMDTVTEYRLAIEMAKLGGLGVIHRNLTLEDQLFQVEKVKHHLNGLIEKPICVHEDETISSILQRKHEKGYGFNSFPVLNNQDTLTGIITGNDFEFCQDQTLKAKDIMSTELLTAPKETTIDQAYELMIKAKKKNLPLITHTKEIAGMYVFSDVKRIKTGSAESYNIDWRGQLKVAAAIGVGEEAIKRANLLSEKADVLVIDTAHADSKYVIETLNAIKKSSSLDVVVGNVSVGKSIKRLIDAGADGIKIGQGPGSICTTRVIAGVGRPQVSAIYDCSMIAQEYGIPICGDGGLRNSGDIPIAIGAGAHSLMMGGMLVGTKESPGEVIYFNGRQWKEYRGMGSLGAMEKNLGSRQRYSQKENSTLIPEGVEGIVPYKGTLKDVIDQSVGGLKRAMGYLGVKSIDELREKADFDRITSAGYSESHPHTITITKDSPNYAKRERVIDDLIP